MSPKTAITENEPIAAIATPLGEGGIAVIRVSGNKAIEQVDTVFSGKELAAQPANTIHYGKIVRNGEVVDEVMASVFRNPNSYTGEDTVEISCHGGVLITQLVLETLLETGVRAAKPGEFTHRAFLNGKMNLEQAEAVADMIHAKSRKAVDAAGQQLEGSLGKHIQKFRQQIIDATALVELELDFIEEDVEFADYDQLKQILTELDAEIEELLSTYETGRLVKHGVQTVIAGLPNAGKSTLLNKLIGQDRAIVSEIAGTTRDTIDVDWSYDGLMFKLIDTAGLRDQTTDTIEAEGIKRSEEAIGRAHIIVYLKDLSHPLTKKELDDINAYRSKAVDVPFLLVGTKADIAAEVEDRRLDYDLMISSMEGLYMDELKQLMKDRALEQKKYDSSGILITSTRHRDALNKTQEHVRNALQALQDGMSGDFLAIDLRSALQHLGEITGEITNEHVLDSIFSRFCIGK